MMLPMTAEMADRTKSPRFPNLRDRAETKGAVQPTTRI